MSSFHQHKRTVFGGTRKAPAVGLYFSPGRMMAGAISSTFRRILSVIIGAVAAGILITGCATSSNHKENVELTDMLISVENGRFQRSNQPYAYIGVNLWYAAYLGAPTAYGNRERLLAELDLLSSLGVTNLRILGASERSPFRKALTDTFRDESRNYNEALLEGLDFTLSEMAKRDMQAVIYLNNFWEWSGGMGTYLYWTNGGTYVDLGDPEYPWPAFQNVTAQFYENAPANDLYRHYIEEIVTRTNTVTGKAYRDDPTIMAWQLANEPRLGADFLEGDAGLLAFYRWIDETAHFIKGLDSNHLISSGNEGYMGCNEIESCFVDAHKSDAIDYLTFHIWPRNWSWFDANRPDETFVNTLHKTKAYIQQHIQFANTLNKPIVLEEFGFDRDEAALDTESSIVLRDKFLTAVFADLEDSIVHNGPFMGVNIWAWGGYGRAEHDDYLWRDGDTEFTGDPPQEPQGRNSIYSSDVSTLAIIKDLTEKLSE